MTQTKPNPPACPFFVLGRVEPQIESDWRASKLGPLLVVITRIFGLDPLVDPLHGPEPRSSWKSEADHAQVRRFNFDGPGGSWHYDGDTTPGAITDNALVLWASNTPTQVRWANDETLWTPPPFVLILFSNSDCRHRRPPGAPRERWTFRQRVTIESARKYLTNSL